MKRFAVLVLSICTTAILLALEVGSQGLSQTGSFASLGFGLCQNKPCFLKIVPGETSWPEMLDQLKPYPQIKYTPPYGVIIKGQPVRVTSYANPPQSVDVINSEALPDDLTIGAAIREFGVPCGVSFYPVTAWVCPLSVCKGLYSMEIRYESLILQVRLRLGYLNETEITRLDPDLPVSALVLVNPARFHGTETAYCHISPTMDYRVSPGAGRVDTPWLGFASTQRYLEYARRGGA